MDRKMTALQQRLMNDNPSLMLETNASMAAHTTLHLGGLADLLATPETTGQLAQLLRTAHEEEIPVTVIGHGSNLLVRDGGIRGLTIRLAGGLRGLTVQDNTITVMAGTMLSTVANTAAAHSLSGFEFAGGIPGTIGGAVCMNAGAYGGEMSQVVCLVEGLTMDGNPLRFTGDEMDFSYRHSRLSSENWIVTRTVLQLTPGSRTDIEARMMELNRSRAEKQPLNEPSAGSAFKRPASGFAAALIDQCGLKGFTCGGAAISEKHAGFAVNRGGTAADFIRLLNEVRDRVLAGTGVLLEPEIRIIGEDSAES